MKKIIVSIVLISAFSGGLRAELPNGLIYTNSDSYFVISLGPNYCFSDANNSSLIIGPYLNQSPLQNWDVSVGYRKKFHNNLGYKVGLSVDNFTGYDIKPYTRGLYSFQSNLIQLSVQGEYSINFETDCYCKDPNYLYGFLGTGVMASNANLDISKGMIISTYKYKKNDIAPVVFLGIGYLYHISKNLAIDADYKIEYPFSDYIDGFKPPFPTSTFNDLIQGFSVGLSLKL